MLGLNYFNLKATPSGFIVVQESSSNSVLIMNKKLKTKIAFQGKASTFQTSLQKKFKKRPCFSFEDNKIIWLRQDSSFSSLDLTNQDIENYLAARPLGYTDSEIYLVQCLPKFEKEQFILLYRLVEEAHDILCYYDHKACSAKTIEPNKLLLGLNSIHTIDMFSDLDQVLVVGKMNTELSEDVNVLLTTKFEGEMKLIDYYILPDDFSKCKLGSVLMTRSDDMFFVTADNFILSLRRNQDSQIVLSKVIELDIEGT